MENFFMNTGNSKTNEPHMFRYNLIDKLNLKNPNKNMALANLSIYYTWKILNQFIKIISIKYLHLHEMKLLIYQIDHIIYLLYKIILNT